MSASQVSNGKTSHEHTMRCDLRTEVVERRSVTGRRMILDHTVGGTRFRLVDNSILMGNTTGPIKETSPQAADPTDKAG